jgi:hypothetical protein
VKKELSETRDRKSSQSYIHFLSVSAPIRTHATMPRPLLLGLLAVLSAAACVCTSAFQMPKPVGADVKV